MEEVIQIQNIQCLETKSIISVTFQGLERDSQGFERDSQGFERDSQGFERDSQGFERDSQGCEHDSQGFELLILRACSMQLCGRIESCFAIIMIFWNTSLK